MNIYQLEISGVLACFTRPEFKVERMSYEVITPSACRAIFEAIYWKPQMMWKIKVIEVLNPIAFTHIKRCETAATANVYKTEIIAADHRQLRSSLILRDVQYRVTAELVSLDGNDEKHNAMFTRRATKGQCFTQPYLGCREFAADWRLIAEGEELQPPIDETRDLGMMLYDLDFTNEKSPEPHFFRAMMTSGVITL